MIIPMLTCADTAQEIEFCKKAFGAAVLSERPWTDGRIIHATLAIGQDLFMVHGVVAHLQSRPPQMDGASSVVIYLYLPNADLAMKAALAAGATVLLPIADQPWGDRVGRILDPAGHVWNIATQRPKAL